MVTTTTMLGLAAFLVSGMAAPAPDDCDFRDDRELTVPAGDLSRVAIVAGSGSLRVEGRYGLQEIVVVGRACASDEDLLDALRVSARPISADRRLAVETHYPDRDGRRSGTARIDLVVSVPLGMEVEIEDSSGGIVVSGTGRLHIDDSSGEIRASGVNGEVTIEDSSGGIDLRDVAGDVDVDDGSGGLEVRDVQGSVRLRDGSGGIVIAEVDGSVLIDSDGSGGIEVRNVGGDFRVGRDGSGSIRYSGVEGSVDVPRKR